MAPGATGDAWSVTLDGSQVLATGCARCHCATSSLDEFCKALQHRGSTGMSISDMPDKSLVVVSKMFFLGVSLAITSHLFYSQPN